jgi:hypothetical protein
MPSCSRQVGPARAGSYRDGRERPSAGRSVPTGKNPVLPESLRPFGITFHYGKNDIVREQLTRSVRLRPFKFTGRRLCALANARTL